MNVPGDDGRGEDRPPHALDELDELDELDGVVPSADKKPRVRRSQAPTREVNRVSVQDAASGDDLSEEGSPRQTPPPPHLVEDEPFSEEEPELTIELLQYDDVEVEVDEHGMEAFATALLGDATEVSPPVGLSQTTTAGDEFGDADADEGDDGQAQARDPLPRSQAGTTHDFFESEVSVDEGGGPELDARGGLEAASTRSNAVHAEASEAAWGDAEQDEAKEFHAGQAHEDVGQNAGSSRASHPDALRGDAEETGERLASTSSDREARGTMQLPPDGGESIIRDDEETTQELDLHFEDSIPGVRLSDVEEGDQHGAGRKSDPRPPAPVAPKARTRPEKPPAVPPSQHPAHPWWQSFFQEDYARTVWPLSASVIARQCDFVEDSLGLVSPARIMDVGCGIGHVAFELARRGYDVVGVDVSKNMVARAKREARSLNLPVEVIHADMRELSDTQDFDAVLCMGTTFGYFEDHENESMLLTLRGLLRPGGRIFLDMMNRDVAMRWLPHLRWYEGNGCLCMEEAEFDSARARLSVRRSIIEESSGQREANYDLRLYSMHEAKALLEQNGFRLLSVSGAFTTPGVFFASNSPQLLLAAERIG